MIKIFDRFYHIYLNKRKRDKRIFIDKILDIKNL